MTMSDLVLERVSLTDARPVGGDFRPSDPTVTTLYATAQDRPEEPDRFELGYAAGLREAEASFAVERAELKRLVESAQCFAAESSVELETLIAETVFALVAQAVGDVAIERAEIRARVAQAVALIEECDAARTVRLHPADLALLDDLSLPLTTLADPDLDRGEIRIDCTAGWIESGVSPFLNALRAQLGIEAAQL
jgi:flagellar biosynthesis/type III secretory pathway protein FliH